MEAMDGLWTIYRRSVRRTDRMPTKCRHMPTLCSKEKRKGVREMDSKLSQMYIIQNHSLLFFLDNFVLESLFRTPGSSLCNFSQCVCYFSFNRCLKRRLPNHPLEYFDRISIALEILKSFFRYIKFFLVK